MKIFNRRIWVTCDGFEHTSADSAQKHAEEQYGKRVLLLTKRIAATNSKYSEIVSMVEANMHLLREIVIWNDDKRPGEGLAMTSKIVSTQSF